VMAVGVCSMSGWYVTRNMLIEFLIRHSEDRASARRYPYFDVVVGLVWSRDPKSYAGGSVCYW
jgi:hypothetical protein